MVLAVACLFSLGLASGSWNGTFPNITLPEFDPNDWVPNSPCTTEFVLGPNDASKSTSWNPNHWVWITGYSNDCRFEGGEEKTFIVDLSSLEGTNNLGERVSFEGEEGVDLELCDTFGFTTIHVGSTRDLDHFDVGGFFDEEDDFDWSISRTWTECDFGRKNHTFTIRNKDTAVDYVNVKIIIENAHDTCELEAAVRAWLIAIAVILGICCGCGILIAILVSCGCIVCCNQNKKTQVHHTTIQVQQGEAEMQPAQPTFGGPGAPDMTQYSTGLQPGWEAKWDVTTNRPYWVDHNNQRSVWEDPRANMGSA